MAPQVVAPKPLLVRRAFDVKSEKLGEIAPGTLVFVLDSRQMADGSRRTHFAFATPSGGMSEGGWVTSLTKDGAETMAVAERGRRQAPVLAADASDGAGKALQSLLKGKGGAAKEAMATAAALLAAKAAKGGNAALANQPPTAALAAVAAALSGKGGAAETAKQKAAKAAQKAGGGAAGGGAGGKAEAAGSTTPKGEKGGSGAQSARGNGGSTSARGGGKDGSTTPKGKGGGGSGSTSARGEQLGSASIQAQKNSEIEQQAARERVKREVAEAKEGLQRLVSKKSFEPKEFRYARNEGHRPSGRPDEMPSRHVNIKDAGMLLMFNCHRASFELLQGDLGTLPESEALDIKSLVSPATIGRVKIAPEKGTPFVERVEFPNEWRMGDEHGLEHDGLQVCARRAHGMLARARPTQGRAPVPSG